ncbi:MAG: tRNA-binding protein [Candidatus Nitrosocaldus sp.]
MSISYDEFKRLDIRVGIVVKAESIEGKSRIMKAIVDIGNERRELIVGGVEYYKPEDMVGRKVIVLANLEPKKIAGIRSHGMLLAADVDGKPYWLTVDGDAPVGSKVR